MKRTFLIGAAIAAVALVAAGGVIAVQGDDVRSVDALPAYDLSDRRDLAGFADDVWFGEVVERLPQEDLSVSGPGAVPVTRFRVRVAETLKGSLSGEVIVAQDGGADPESGDVVLVDDNPLLEVGSTYLLATAYWQDGAAHSVVAEGLADLPADRADERRSLRASFKEAIQNQRRPSGPR
jgi:hypothetical protein